MRGRLCPVRSAGGELRGVAIRLEDGLGHTGWGEASPLPGYSPDTVGDCAGALERALSRPLPESMAELCAAVAAVSADLPAARFALESALLGLFARRQGVRVAELLGEVAAPIARTTLLPADIDAAPIARTTLLPADIDAAVAGGSRCFKLKVGRPGNWPEELAIAQDLRARLPPGSRIRVDANGAWDPDTARSRIADLEPLDIELIEQPTGPAEISRLGRTSIPLALDESLREPVPDDVLDITSVFVLKPAVLGGSKRCLELAARGRRHGIDSIVSHLRDGAVAMSACIELALAIGAARPHGLDAHAQMSTLRLAP